MQGAKQNSGTKEGGIERFINAGQRMPVVSDSVGPTEQPVDDRRHEPLPNLALVQAVQNAQNGF